MQKPTVFFSHSSLDREYITLLREKLVRRTSKTIEVFQSSDGESIPFGNNWVHKIEENLDKAKVMFVFISPKSLMTSWIYFESGFAYAKKIKVIPVGIKGVNVGEIRPPLNLLQGFNITSLDGVNNIITVVNREFGCDFEENFSTADYEDLVALDAGAAFKYLHDINYVRFGFPTKVGPDELESVLSEEPLKVVQEALRSLSLRCTFSTADKLHSHGMIFQLGSGVSSIGSRIELKVDPFRFTNCSDIVPALLNSLYTKNEVRRFWLKVVLNGNVKLETTDYKVSFRLQKHGIDMHEENGRYYKYKNLIFNLQEAASEYDYREVDSEHLHVVFEPHNFNSGEVLELVDILFEANVICTVAA